MISEEKLARFREMIDKSKSTVFFGGAGVSTASGIPDFRSAKGVFVKNAELSPEEIVSAPFFYRNTADFYAFYRDKMLFPNAKPNAAHRKLAELEKAGKLRAVITQNIDGLHRIAGSKNVVELHGSAHRNHCLSCGKSFDLSYVLQCKGVPVCPCGGIVKPDVVLYGEALDERDLTLAALYTSEADLLIVGGTSLAVYPAASFVYDFHGKHLVLINKSVTGADGYADLVFHDDIAEVFDRL
ncbi:MAG: NAD-dependent protein deacylase [Clostridia bacterium]|nr:NAD-dependent protein deacylase [Clostridia bacterium]